MRVTFIGHSGFIVELDRKYLLFDYFQGELPVLSQEKPLYIFVSHKHQDHFNPRIFQLAGQYPKVSYILSYDIKLKPFNISKWKAEDINQDQLLSVRANETTFLQDVEITTYKSTDEGVAFLITTEGKCLYHGGDLNWWHWKEEDKQSNNHMAANYKREIDKMTDLSIDIAFLPLDPRQEEDYWLGMDYMLKTAKVNTAFPMHMWNDYSVIDRFKQDGYLEKNSTKLISIHQEGQTWEV